MDTSKNYTAAEMKIKECVCEHGYQDKKHGRSMRAMNPCKSGASGTAYRCTVCGRKHE